MRKISLLLLCILMISLVTFTNVFAINNDLSDNIKMEMVTVDSIRAIQENNNLSAADKVKQIVESVLTAKLLAENHFKDFDFSVVQDNSTKDNKSLNFFNKKVKLFKEMRK